MENDCLDHCALGFVDLDCELVHSSWTMMIHHCCRIVAAKIHYPATNLIVTNVGAKVCQRAHMAAWSARSMSMKAFAGASSLSEPLG